ncbi:MAG: hypothetical protein KAY32_17990 [Candidatus Eisenbacteria sp.]|nr:hypothetical protein [Candidatus Eisenbacteria bacterium]
MAPIPTTLTLISRSFLGTVPTWVYVLTLLASSTALWGCQELTRDEPTLLDALHRLCYYESVDCEQIEIDVLLHLDTVNLPSHSGPAQRLILSSLPTTPIAGTDRITFFIEGADSLPPEIDPGILNELGWKVELVAVRLEYCDACYTNAGLLRILGIRGPLAHAEFIWDPDDTLALYIETRAAP